MNNDAQRLIRGVAKAYRRSAQANSGKIQGSIGSVGSGSSGPSGSVGVGPASVPSGQTNSSSGAAGLSALTNAASQIFSWF